MHHRLFRNRYHDLALINLPLQFLSSSALWDTLPPSKLLFHGFSVLPILLPRFVAIIISSLYRCFSRSEMPPPLESFSWSEHRARHPKASGFVDDIAFNTFVWTGKPLVFLSASICSIAPLSANIRAAPLFSLECFGPSEGFFLLRNPFSVSLSKYLKCLRVADSTAFHQSSVAFSRLCFVPV